MSANDEIGRQVFYITSDIKKFQRIDSIADYLKVKSSERKLELLSSGHGIRGGYIRWLRSWSRSDKLALVIAAATVVALAVTVLALLVAGGLLIL